MTKLTMMHGAFQHLLTSTRTGSSPAATSTRTCTGRSAMPSLRPSTRQQPRQGLPKTTTTLRSPNSRLSRFLIGCSLLVNRLRRRKGGFLLLLRTAVILLIVFRLGVLLATATATATASSSPQNKLQLQKQNITAVVMNHARPRNIQESELLPTLLANPLITEVLLLHSNPKTAFHYQHTKVQNINATLENAKMGLSLRFWFAGHKATNEWILLVDDELMIII